MIDIKNKLLEIAYKYKVRVIQLINNVSMEKVCKFLIVFLILVIGFMFFANSKSFANKTIKDIFYISDNVRQFYVEKPNYWGLNTQTAIRENIVDSKYILKDKIVLGKGLSVLIGKGFQADTLMFLDNSFDIVVNGLDKKNCISLIEADISKENIVKLREISLQNSKGLFSFRWEDGKYSLTVKKYIAKDICSDVNNSLLWSVE